MRSASNGAKVLFNEVNELLVVDIASADHYDVLSEVVALVEVNDHFTIDLADVVDITEDWLTHHMLAVAIEVDVLHERFLRILVCCLQLLPDGVFLKLEVIVVINTVTEHISENLNGLGDLLREAESVIKGVFARSVSVQLRASVLDFDLQLAPRTVSRTFKVQVLEEMSSAGAFQRLMPRTRADEDTDGGNGLAAHVFSAHTNAILSGRRLHWTVKVERLGDLTALQVAKILRSRLP